MNNEHTTETLNLETLMEKCLAVQMPQKKIEIPEIGVFEVRAGRWTEKRPWRLPGLQI